MGPQKLTGSDCNNCWCLDFDIPSVETSIAWHVSARFDLEDIPLTWLTLHWHFGYRSTYILLSYPTVWVTCSVLCDMLLEPMRRTKIQPWKNRRDMVYRFGLILLKISLKSWNPVNELFLDDVCNRHGEFVLPSLFPIKSPIRASYFAKGWRMSRYDCVMNGFNPSET